MDVATDPWLLHSKENRAQVIENMEFDSEGERLISRRGLGSPLYTFPADILYIWYDYGLNNYIVFLKNKNVYTYEFGKTPTFIGTINGDVTHKPQLYILTKTKSKKFIISIEEKLKLCFNFSF